MSLRLIVLAAVACASAATCTSPLDQHEQRVVGVIDNAGLAIDALVAPDTVRAGTSFAATVSTFGSSCIRPDGAEVVTASTRVDITPYDWAPPPGTPCPRDLRVFPRSVTLVFSVPGSAVVSLHGRGATGALTIEKSLTVLP
jgi:hypothetical protein